MTNKTKAAIEEAAIKARIDNIVCLTGKSKEAFRMGAKEVIEHPERYDLIQRYAYTAKVEHVERLIGLLRDVDDLLMSLEDYTHGKD